MSNKNNVIYCLTHFDRCCTDKDITYDNIYNNIYTKNLYLIGTVVGRYGQIVHKRLKNWVAGTPVFMYQWAPNSAQPDQMWVVQEEQKPEILPNTIPIYK